MKKVKYKIYLDTSVISAFYDVSKYERSQLTKKFWDLLRSHDVYISSLVRQELSNTVDALLKNKLLKLAKSFKNLKLSKEIETLANKYINVDIVPGRFKDDALHIAFVSVNNLDLLVSWNFQHLVKIKTRHLVNMVNIENGYKPIEIIAPPEF